MTFALGIGITTAVLTVVNASTLDGDLERSGLEVHRRMPL